MLHPLSAHPFGILLSSLAVNKAINNPAALVLSGAKEKVLHAFFFCSAFCLFPLSETEVDYSPLASPPRPLFFLFLAISRIY